QLVLQSPQLAAATADQHELALDVSHRLLEDLAPAPRVLHSAVPLPPERGTRALGRRELAQLLEGDPEQVPQPQELLKPLHVGLVVDPVRARLAPGYRQKPDLLVVKNRPRGGARPLRDLADAQRAHVSSSSSARVALDSD